MGKTKEETARKSGEHCAQECAFPQVPTGGAGVTKCSNTGSTGVWPFQFGGGGVASSGLTRPATCLPIPGLAGTEGLGTLSHSTPGGLGTLPRGTPGGLGTLPRGTPGGLGTLPPVAPLEGWDPAPWHPWSVGDLPCGTPGGLGPCPTTPLEGWGPAPCSPWRVGAPAPRGPWIHPQRRPVSCLPHGTDIAWTTRLGVVRENRVPPNSAAGPGLVCVRVCVVCVLAMCVCVCGMRVCGVRVGNVCVSVCVV